MISNKDILNLITFPIHDGCIHNVKWINSQLFFTISVFENSPNSKCVSLCFHGVNWIRSLCDEKHDGFIQGTPYTDYPLIEQTKLNENYKEYVCYGLLDNIYVSNDGVIFINDIFFFNANSVEKLNK